MASSSKKYRRSSSKSKTRSKSCKGGRKSRSRDTKTHKWHQKGCQSGGGSMTGGWPWAPSDVHHQTAGTVPQSINGNHYAFNTERMPPPQNSNHLMFSGCGGSRRRSKNSKITAKDRRRQRRHPRRHRRFIGEQHGGMAEYLPEAANSLVRGIAETPAMVANTLQGASTGFVTSSVTDQPIGDPVSLK